MKRLRGEENALMLLLFMVGAIAGFIAGKAPLLVAVVLVIITITAVLAVIDPIYGIAFALLAGPLKPVFDTYIPAFPLDPGQLFLILAVGSWLLRGLKDHAITIPGSPILLPVAIFTFTALMSMMNALSFGYAVNELIKWAQILLVIVIVTDRADRKRIPFFVGAVILSVLIQALIGLWQFGLRGDGPEHFLILGDRFYRAYGTFEQPNPFGGFLGMGLMLAIGLTLAALMKWWTSATDRDHANRYPIKRIFRAESLQLILLFALCLIIGGALLASWSRGAWLGAAAGVLAILFVWPRRVSWGLLLVLIFLVMGLGMLKTGILPSSITDRLLGFTESFQALNVRGVDISDANYAVIERLAHWQAAAEMVRYHPWFGVGIGNYEPVYGGYALLNWPYPLGHAHNIYLNMAAETGLVGLAAYLGMWITIIILTWRVTRSDQGWRRFIAIGLLGAWIHLSVHQMVDTLFVANIHLHLGVMLGVLSLLINDNVKEIPRYV